MKQNFKRRILTISGLILIILSIIIAIPVRATGTDPDVDPLDKVVYMPDYNLKRGVNRCIQLYHKVYRSPYQDITVRDLRSTHLGQYYHSDTKSWEGPLVGKGIKDLTGLEEAFGTTVIDISNNEITDLSPLSKIYSLHQIEATGNKIRSLAPIRNLTNLHVADFSENPNLSDISALKTGADRYLFRLNLTGTSVSDISSLTGSKSLREFYASRTQIKNLSPLADCKNLKYLRLDFCRTGLGLDDGLSDLTPLKKLKLNYLSAGMNSIKSLDGLQGSADTMEILDIEINQVEDIGLLKEFTALRILSAESNYIVDASPLANQHRLMQSINLGSQIRIYKILEGPFFINEAYDYRGVEMPYEIIDDGIIQLSDNSYRFDENLEKGEKPYLYARYTDHVGLHEVTIKLDTNEYTTQAEINNEYIRDGELEVPQYSEPDLNELRSRIQGLPVSATITPLNWDTSTIGSKVVDVLIEYTDGSKKTVQIPINVVEVTDAQQSEVQTGAIIVQVGEIITEERVLKEIYNQPPGSIVKVINIPDTSTPGETHAVVEITFEDGSTKIYKIPVTVVSGELSTGYTPKVQLLTFELGEKITKEKLLKGITNLPSEAAVVDYTLPDSSIAGPTSGVIILEFPDGSKTSVTIPVDIIGPNESEQYYPEVQTIIVNQGDPLTEEQIIAAITNLPSTAKIIKTKVPTTAAPGYREGIVTVELSDGSSKDIRVPVSVLPKLLTEAEQFMPNVGEGVYVKKNDVLEDQQIIKQIINLPKNAIGTVISKPSTAEEGVYQAKVEIKFIDGSKKEVNVPVNVLGIDATQADLYSPAVKGGVRVPVGYYLKDSDILADITNLPTNLKEKTILLPSTDKVGYEMAYVKLIFPDGSIKTFGVPVEVYEVTEATKYEPQVSGELVVKVGDKITDKQVTDKITNLPTGVDIKVQKPDTSLPGRINAIVTITFPDKSKTIVRVPVRIVGDVPPVPNPNPKPPTPGPGPNPPTPGPGPNPPTPGPGTDEPDKPTPPRPGRPYAKGTLVVKVGYKVSAEEVIAKIENIPQNAKIHVFLPDTSKPGMTKSTVTITANGQKDVIQVPVKVIEDIKQLTDAQKFSPIPKGMIIVMQNDPILESDVLDKIENIPPNAKTSVGLPSTANVGLTMAIVDITFADGSKSTVKVPVMVIARTPGTTDAETNKPKVNGDVVIEAGKDLTEQDILDKIDNIPPGADVTVILPDTNTPGEKEATVIITYPDGSKEEVKVPVNVLPKQPGKNDGQKYNPRVTGELVVKQGHIITKNEILSKTTGIPANANTTVTIPDTSTPGTKSSKVNIIFEDGMRKDLTVIVRVLKASPGSTDAEIFNPQPNGDITINENDKITEEDILDKIDNIPPNADVTVNIPDTSTPGDKVAEVIITYPDGSESVVYVPIKVKPKQPTPGPGGNSGGNSGGNTGGNSGGNSGGNTGGNTGGNQPPNIGPGPGGNSGGNQPPNVGSGPGGSSGSGSSGTGSGSNSSTGSGSGNSGSGSGYVPITPDIKPITTEVPDKEYKKGSEIDEKPKKDIPYTGSESKVVLYSTIGVIVTTVGGILIYKKIKL